MIINKMCNIRGNITKLVEIRCHNNNQNEALCVTNLKMCHFVLKVTQFISLKPLKMHNFIKVIID